MSVRARGRWLCVVAILLAGERPSNAEDAPAAPNAEADAVAAKVKEAEAKVAAKSYRAALDLYASAVELADLSNRPPAPSDGPLLADAAQCAFLAKDFAAAKRYAALAAERADAAFSSSPKGKALASLVPLIEPAIRRQALERRQFAETAVASAIKALPRHKDVLRAAYFAPPSAKGYYELKPELAFDDFSVRAEAMSDGKHVYVLCVEFLAGEAEADARAKAIMAQIRAERGTWEKAVYGRTRDTKVELREDAADSTEDDAKSPATIRTTTFHLNSSTSTMIVDSTVALVVVRHDLDRTVGDTTIPGRWSVATHLFSVSFK